MQEGRAEPPGQIAGDAINKMASSTCPKSMRRAAIGLSIVLLGGCASLFSRHHGNYETIATDDVHDTQAASKANRQGADLLAKGKLDKAEVHFKKALAADVNFGPAHNNLGVLYYNRKEYYLAAWEFDYAAKLMKDQAEPHNNLGLVLESVGKLNQAIDAYELACIMQPENPQYLGNQARARIRRGKDDPRTKELLNDLIAVDTRPDWVCWAREMLALRRDASSTPTPTLPSGNPQQPAETGNPQQPAGTANPPESSGSLEALPTPPPEAISPDTEPDETIPK